MTTIRTPTDLGAVIRDRRKQLGLDQASLAKRIGVSRQWVIGIERGRARAEVGLVLRALDILGIGLGTQSAVAKRGTSVVPTVDIDSIIATARKKKQ